LTNLTLKCAN